MGLREMLEEVRRRDKFFTAEEQGVLLPLLSRGAEREETELRTLRRKADALFRDKSYQESADAYGEGLGIAARGKEASLLYSNRAAARMKMGDTTGAEEDCGRALAEDAGNMKALLRMAQLKGINGLGFVKRALDINPQDKRALALRKLIEQKIDALLNDPEIREALEEFVDSDLPEHRTHLEEVLSKKRG